MPLAPDSNGIPRYVEGDVGAEGRFSSLLNMGMGWVSEVFTTVFGRLPKGGIRAAVTDANGFITVAHGLGKVPTAVVATILDDSPTIPEALKINVTSITATSFRARIRRTDPGFVNAPFADNLVNFSWVVL